MLTDEKFRLLYNSGINEPLEFYSKAFLNSNHLDLGLGYFSSSAFRVLAPALAPFIHSGGKIRIAINDELSFKDKEMLSSSQEPKTKFLEDKILLDLASLFEHLSSYDEHFFKCLSYLFQNDRIILKAMLVTNDGFGIAHHKFGIFSDEDGNKIAFNGSTNFSQNALLHHVESMTCFSSWSQNEIADEIIDEYSQLFIDIWADRHPNLELIPLDRVKTRIIQKYPKVTEDELKKSHNKLLQKLIKKGGLGSVSVESLIEKLGLNDQEEKKPHLPDFISQLHDYQIEAFENWRSNEYQGLFEMATGSGKTITALNCALQLYNEIGYSRVLILVPSLTLTVQWEKEVREFGFGNIINVSSTNKSWRDTLTRTITRARFGNNSYCMIVTYQTFASTDFQVILPKIPPDTLLIADEVHNFGTKRMVLLHPSHLKRRIGLSATPARHFDEWGTHEILKYFNSESKSTITYSLKQAIDEGKLSSYYYYPYLVKLTPSELNEYIKITKQLYFYLDSNRGVYSENITVEKLLLRRKRIVHKAINKKAILKDIIVDIQDRQGTLDYTLLYVPEGKNGAFDEEDTRLINEYSSILYNEFGIVQHQFIGETEGRQNVLEDFAEGKISVLTAMKCLDEGIDIKRTETAIFAASTANPRQYIQRRGRILRKHEEKSIAKIYDMLVIPEFEFENKAEQNIEVKMIKNELKRVVEFANLSINTYEAKSKVHEMVNDFGIDIYELEED